jgi:hypothetical protein
MRCVPLGRVNWDKLFMWYNRSLLRKWRHRLIFILDLDLIWASHTFSKLVVVRGKLSWFFLMCVPATCLSKNSVLVMGDLIHACCKILGIFCAPPFFAQI